MLRMINRQSGFARTASWLYKLADSELTDVYAERQNETRERHHSIRPF